MLLVNTPLELGEEEGLFLNAKLQKSSACKASSSWSCTSLKRLLRYRLIFLWKQWHELPFKIAGWADFIQKSPSSVWSSTFLKFLSAEQWLEVLVLFVMFIGNLCFFLGKGDFLKFVLWKLKLYEFPLMPAPKKLYARCLLPSLLFRPLQHCKENG